MNECLGVMYCPDCQSPPLGVFTSTSSTDYYLRTVALCSLAFQRLFEVVIKIYGVICILKGPGHELLLTFYFLHQTTTRSPSGKISWLAVGIISCGIDFKRSVAFINALSSRAESLAHHRETSFLIE